MAHLRRTNGWQACCAAGPADSSPRTLPCPVARSSPSMDGTLHGSRPLVDRDEIDHLSRRPASWPGAIGWSADPSLQEINLGALVPPEFHEGPHPWDGYPDAGANALVARILANRLN